MESLRDEQKRMVRDRILDALAVEITERGLIDLSVPEIAARAGVSQRTVYNYFDNKDALVASLGAWSEQQMEARGGRIVETDLNMIAEAVLINFKVFSEMGPISTALARIEAAAEVQSPAMVARKRLQSKRTNAVSAALSQLRPDLDADALSALTALFRTVISFGTWNRLANDFGLSGDDAGRVTAWAHSVLLDALKDQRGPFDIVG